MTGKSNIDQPHGVFFKKPSFLTFSVSSSSAPLFLILFLSSSSAPLFLTLSLSSSSAPLFLIYSMSSSSAPLFLTLSLSSSVPSFLTLSLSLSASLFLTLSRLHRLSGSHNFARHLWQRLVSVDMFAEQDKKEKGAYPISKARKKTRRRMESWSAHSEVSRRPVYFINNR